MGRRNRAEAAVVAEYARVNGIALRTAQLHAQRNHPDYVGFLRQRAAATGAAEQAAAEAGQAFSLEIEAAVARGQSNLERAQAVERESYATLVAMQAEKRRAIQVRDVNLQNVIRAEIEAQKSWREARVNLERAEVQAGNLIPSTELDALKRRFILPLREVWKNMPSEIAAMVPAFDQEEVMRQAAAWRDTRMMPALEAAAAAVEAMSHGRGDEKT